MNPDPGPDPIKKLDKLLKGLPRKEISEEFEKTFWAKFEMRKNLSRKPGVGLLPALALAGCAGVLAVFLTVFAITPRADEAVIEVTKGTDALPGERLKPGSRIETGAHEWVILKFGKKSHLKILEGAEIEIEQLKPRFFPGSTVFRLVKGEALVSIDEGTSSPYPLEIRTVNGFVRTLGTQFTVRAPAPMMPGSYVGVLRGKVLTGTPASDVVLEHGHEVILSGGALAPRPMTEAKIDQLEELFQFSKRNQIILLLPLGPRRVDELLKSCPVYMRLDPQSPIAGEIKKIALSMQLAVSQQSPEQHLRSARSLERVIENQDQVDRQPVLLFIGSYYSYLNQHEESARVFEKAARDRPRSSWASLGLLAAAKVRLEKLHQPEESLELLTEILTRYPESYEAPEAARLKKSLTLPPDL